MRATGNVCAITKAQGTDGGSSLHPFCFRCQGSTGGLLPGGHGLPFGLRHPFRLFCRPGTTLARLPTAKRPEGLGFIVEDIPAVEAAGLVTGYPIAVQGAVNFQGRLVHRQPSIGQGIEEGVMVCGAHSSPPFPACIAAIRAHSSPLALR